MAKYIDAEIIRNEVIKHIEDNRDIHDGYALSAMHECEEILSFLDSLQQEPPENIVVIARVFLDALSKTPYNNKPITDAQIIVRQLLLFFENPKEYNPDAIFEQQKEEMPNKTLDKAADNFVWEVMENDEEGISDLCRKLRPSSKISDFYDALGEFFKAGAKWMAGQGYTTEETVYYERLCDETRIMVDFGRDGERGGFNPGDRVIVQIRKKEESK